MMNDIIKGVSCIHFSGDNFKKDQDYFKYIFSSCCMLNFMVSRLLDFWNEICHYNYMMEDLVVKW